MAHWVGNEIRPQHLDKISYGGTLHELKAVTVSDGFRWQIIDGGKVHFSMDELAFRRNYVYHFEQGIWRRKKNA